MGDRAVVVFTDGHSFSPAIYLHWAGSNVGGLLTSTRTLMEGRSDDLGYCAARFVGVCHEDISGNLSLGMWSVGKDEDVTEREYSHGDAGVFVVNISTGTWIARAYNGYGFADPCDVDAAENMGPLTIDPHLESEAVPT